MGLRDERVQRSVRLDSVTGDRVGKPDLPVGHTGATDNRRGNARRRGVQLAALAITDQPLDRSPSEGEQAEDDQRGDEGAQIS